MAVNDYTVEASGDFSALLPLDSRSVARNLSRATNFAARKARTIASAEMREQVAFPARYLVSAQGRLQQTKKATETDPSAVITGRGRPTSLARFATNARRSGQRGVRLQVSPGRRRFLPGAFFVNLRSGTDGSTNNLGVAIRLPEGERPSRAYRPKRLGGNLWLLYGPSVDQVFDDVAEDIAPDVAALQEDEFIRLTDLGL